MTEHARVIPTNDTTQLLEGDCGVVLKVLTPCPDEPDGVFRCACGAEVHPRNPPEEK
jgi:hypothetical protein